MTRPCLLFTAALACCLSLAQAEPSTCTLHGRVLDTAGRPVPAATISISNTGRLVRADASGHFVFATSCDAKVAVTLTASATGMRSKPVQAVADVDLSLVLEPATVQQSASVTTTRSSADLGPTANTISTLTSADLNQYAALTLDERLRQHAGFELFRRSSSWVANPTTEGISLRGLGSTAASRTLVLAGGIPLNDPFGEWVHWNELPPATIEDITLATGGGSDLYGSSALGGVIDIVAAKPGPARFEADIAEAGEETTVVSGRADAQQGRWGELVAAQSFRTEGYTVVAPAIRGLVDVPSNVHFQNARVELDRSLATGRIFLVGNLLNEARGNGTPLTTNGTRLWRYAAGDDWAAGSKLSGRVRGFGSDEAYRQTFSSINAARSSEILTRVQHVETQEFGASTDASFHLTHVAFIAGGDLRDVRATDLEAPTTGALQDISARQRFFGGFGEIVAERGPWSATASLRADESANLQPLPDHHEQIFSPRVGLVRQLPRGIALHASGFRAFRAPSMNELYRTGQVGQQITLANASLRSERATGAEGGANWHSPAGAYAAQATYFWTGINRPVSAVPTATPQTFHRENLGQIQSQGTELALQVHPARALSGTVGYEYAHAIVTAFQVQPALIGKWIPDVPRHTFTAQLRYRAGRAASFTLAARQSGRAYDDSSNIYELHSFFVLDAYAEGRLGAHVTPYLSIQNLLNRSIETARTPNLTLGTPFLAQGGVRVRWGAR